MAGSYRWVAEGSLRSFCVVYQHAGYTYRQGSGFMRRVVIVSCERIETADLQPAGEANAIFDSESSMLTHCIGRSVVLKTVVEAARINRRCAPVRG